MRSKKCLVGSIVELLRLLRLSHPHSVFRSLLIGRLSDRKHPLNVAFEDNYVYLQPSRFGEFHRVYQLAVHSDGTIELRYSIESGSRGPLGCGSAKKDYGKSIRKQMFPSFGRVSDFEELYSLADLSLPCDTYVPRWKHNLLLWAPNAYRRLYVLNYFVL